MKKLVCLLALFTFSFGCQQPVEEGPSNSDIVQGMYDAFAEGDVESVLAVMDSTIVWNEAEGFIYADGNPYEGPGAVVEGVFARLGAEWDYWRLEVSSIINTDDGALAQGRYVAKKKDSGAELNSQFAHVWTIKDGKAMAFQQYTDTKQAAEVYAVEAPDAEDEADNDQ